MDLKNHFFITALALICLGLIGIKPGNKFRHVNEVRDCQVLRGKIECSNQITEYKMNNSNSGIYYQTLGSDD